MKCGIYIIRIGPKYYYGQSIHIENRITQHLSDLKHGRHKNCYMQRAFEKFEDFSWEVVLLCDEDMLDQHEQILIDQYYDEVDCMNLERNATSPFRRRTHSEETKQKMSAAKKGKAQPWNQGDKHGLAVSVVVTYADGSTEEFPTIAACAEHYGYKSPGTIHQFLDSDKPASNKARNPQVRGATFNRS